LTEQQKEYYKGKFQSRTLSTMNRFLCEEIRLFYARYNAHHNRRRNRNRVKSLSIGGDKKDGECKSAITTASDDEKQKEEEEKEKGDDDDGEKDTEIRCGYCKETDHLVDKCDKLKEMICYRCFEPGHKARNCTSPSVYTA